MVATLLRLRFRILANTLRRHPVQAIALVLGAVQALVLLLLIGFGILFLRGDAFPVARDAAVVFAGVAVASGWIAVPLLATGLEPTIDPRKLAPFPIPVSRILVALTLADLLWVPGAATLVGAVAAVALWRDDAAAAVAAVAAAVLGTLTCIAGSRAAAAVAADLVAGRGAVRRGLALLVAAVLLVGPVVAAVRVGLGAAEPIPVMTQTLGHTPLGAAWSLPVALAAGRTADLVSAMVTAAATLAALVAVWWLSVRGAMRSRPARARRRGRGLGAFRLVPSHPAGAIAARSLESWRHDPRYTRQLAILPLLPGLLIWFTALTGVEGPAYAAAPLVAGLLPLAQFAALSYDGTAFTGDVASGVRGRDDRVGRSLALLVIALPVLLVAAWVALLVVDDVDAAAPVLGMTVGALFTGIGVAAVSSALVVVPVPAIGRNPFGAPPGSNTMNVVGSYLVTLVAVVLAAPELVLGILAITTGSTGFGLAAVVVGLAWGTIVLAGGLLIGGRLLDRFAPELLARLTRVAVR